MQIKEVIVKTGLTDRAIRLYIENGLVIPENKKSYTGRNNFNFTLADIEKLEQIALLRKADFSLEQIKMLQAGGEPARKMLLEYLNAKQENVITGQKIVEALKDFPTHTPVTMENVCEKIQKSMEHRDLPEADERPTKGECWEKWLIRIVVISFLTFWSLFGIGVLLTYKEDFLFRHYYLNPINYIGMAYIFIPILMSVLILFLYRKQVLTAKKRKKRRWVSGIAFGILFLVAIQPIGLASVNFVPPFYSETDYPGDYLVLGSYVKMYGDDIYKLFPANIPRSAISEGSQWYPPDKFPDTTKYYYYFQDVFDPSFQIYAEWILPENEFKEELNRIRNYYPEGPNQQVQWGNWTCMSFTDDTLDWIKAESHYYYLIFAYNEKTGGVRYIASYSVDCGEEQEPYFLSLIWD